MKPDGARAAALRTARARAKSGRLAEAEALYQQLLDTQPDDAETLLAWGGLRRAMGDSQSAFAMLSRAIGLGAGLPCMIELAALALDLRDLASAGEWVRQALATAPRSAEVHRLVGRVAELAGDPVAAVEAYRTAIKLDPRDGQARLNLGNLLASQDRRDEALATYAALLRREPDNTALLMAMGQLYGRMYRYRDALDCFDRAERLGVDIAWVLSETAMGLAHVCDWSAARAGTKRRLDARLRRDAPCLIDSYAVLCQDDDPAAQLRLGRRISAAVAAHVASMPRPALVRRTGEGRIRIGYLSADFNQHATALLMTEAFARQDRDRFEIIAYSHSRDDGSATRQRVVAAFDRFVELELEPAPESARRIAADGIDLLIDLKGYTDSARPEIPALRPAPVQASHLGYPGTLGAPWMDYVIADAVVLPFSEQPHWSEQIVHLPHSYQPNDRLRPVPPDQVSRAAHGLPESGFVFACFNHNYKITPDVFAVWMNLLRAVPGSMLWLYGGGHPLAPGNLREAARAAGVDPSRLIFAEPATLEAHIARHRCADLFLDTAPYGAHTTCADSLWAGLPVLTCQGRGFASRVAASLLHAVGLPELVTRSYDDYTALALALAREPERLAPFRARLEAARESAPLFDATLFARGLDEACGTMVERHRSGQRPRAFAIVQDGGRLVHQPA